MKHTESGGIHASMLINVEEEQCLTRCDEGLSLVHSAPADIIRIQ